MVDYSGIGTGFMQGVQMADDRQAKQQALTMQAEQFKMQQQTHQMQMQQQGTQDERNTLLLQQLQMQVKDQSNALAKKDLFRSFEGGTLTDLNAALRDPNISRLFPGIDSVEPVDMSNPQQARAADGMLEPVLANKIVNGRLVKEVRDLSVLKGMSGYSTYDAKRRLEQAGTKAQAIGAEKQLADMQNFFKQNPNATYADFQSTQVMAKATSVSDMKTQYELTKTMSKDKVIDFAYNNPTEFSKMLEIGKMDDKVSKDGMSLYSAAKKVQGDTKIDVGRKTYLDGMVSTIENTNRLRTKLASSDMDWNALAKGMDEITKITGDDWRDLSEKEKASMLERFSFDSDLKTVMAGYIKAMSGAAVSDEERKFYEGAILGGNWSTKETAVSSMDGFLSGLKGGMNSALKGMKLSTPADYLVYKNSLDNIKVDTTKPIADKPAEQKPGFGEKLMTGVSVLGSQIKEGYNNLVGNKPLPSGKTPDELNAKFGDL